MSKYWRIFQELWLYEEKVIKSLCFLSFSLWLEQKRWKEKEAKKRFKKWIKLFVKILDIWETERSIGGAKQRREIGEWWCVLIGCNGVCGYCNSHKVLSYYNNYYYNNRHLSICFFIWIKYKHEYFFHFYLFSMGYLILVMTYEWMGSMGWHSWWLNEAQLFIVRKVY